MLKNSLDRQILGLALPAIVANITTPLLSLVDVAIVGHLGSAVYVGAIAVGGSIFSMLYWLFGFLRFGTSGLTAQALGRGSARQTSLLLQRSLLIALGFGLILITAHYPLGHAALSFMDTDADTAGKAWLYFSILIYGAPASLATFALTGWFVGMQDTRTPMWISLLVNVVNITASLILVYAMDYDLAGVAYGTLLAQWTGFIVSAATCAIHYKVRPQPLSELLHVSELKTFFKVNTDIFLRTVCLIAVTVWFTRTGAGLGPVMLAVNTLLMQFFILFSYIMDGFAFAGEAICGKSYGASDSHSLNRQIHRLLQWGLALAAVFTAGYALGGQYLIALLTNDSGVIETAEKYRLWAAGIPLAGFMAFTWDGVLTGVTRTRLMLGTMSAASAIFFILYLLLFPAIGNHGLWTAFLAYLFTRGCLQHIFYYRNNR
ncbi:MAG: MATE family efflux transporter [Muribaculaceae bacterium]|nr:MATE family efflux transporter [Muribaculaceae bacterium]